MTGALQQNQSLLLKSSLKNDNAIKTLSAGYGLSPEEAAALLSGSIPVEIDEVAGTIAYEVTDADHESSVGTLSPAGSPHDPSEPA
jgi:hypothetical protein